MQISSTAAHEITRVSEVYDNVVTTVTHTIFFDEYLIEVLYLEYSSGVSCYKYRITKGDTLIQSNLEYGQREEAAAGAFLWLVVHQEDN